jgi:serine/threonine protein kinase
MAGRRIVVGGVPYRIEEKVGYGLHSTVYGGRDLRDGRPVAIKIINFSRGSMRIPAETEARQQTFWKEIEMLIYLQPLNPYVIRIFNYDHNDRYGTIIMERGETFRDTLAEYVLIGTPMPLFLIQRFWLQMVEAIYYMHEIGIVHGDCKPENFIQVGPDGTNLRLIDMGISFQLPPNVTSRLQTAVGTPGKF